MIRSFKSEDTQRLHERRSSRKLPKSIQRTALRKLWILDAATELSELKVPPGNRLEVLKGNRKGQHCIRINQQYRICFKWDAGHAFDVEIVDYH
ncbi:MAG: type II toxin-antitoxin system RelE/ParE family toxin [Patescibacteria group bacterium]|nr:type II toxin-antitoxin system RelE/ParE family toxin [Patescibacteria group bacterium]